MTQTTKKFNEIIIDGDGVDSGQVTFRELDSGKIEIEIFQQSFLKETIGFSDRNRLIKWLVNATLESE